MTLKVIGAGFGRTGTSSLKRALEDLGFGPCHHMTEVLAHPEQLPVWEAAVDGKPVEWEAVFRDYQAAVDWPAAAFYASLMEHYPDARVILTVRDAERWYESTRRTIYAISTLTMSPPVVWLLPWLAPRPYRVAAMSTRLIWDQLFGGHFTDRQHAINVFTRSNADVQRRVPPERLLVYDVKQGWEPLCMFLGVAVPDDTPFPHLNDTAQFRRLIHRIRAVVYGVPMVVVALAMGAAWRRVRRVPAAVTSARPGNRRGRSRCVRHAHAPAHVSLTRADPSSGCASHAGRATHVPACGRSARARCHSRHTAARFPLQ